MGTYRRVRKSSLGLELWNKKNKTKQNDTALENWQWVEWIYALIRRSGRKRVSVGYKLACKSLEMRDLLALLGIWWWFQKSSNLDGEGGLQRNGLQICSGAYDTILRSSQSTAEEVYYWAGEQIAHYAKTYQRKRYKAPKILATSCAHQSSSQIKKQEDWILSAT